MKRITLFSDASKIMLLLMAAVFILSACGPGNSAPLPEKGPVQEENGLQDGTALLTEEEIALIHAQSEEVFRASATGGGVTAELTALEPVVLYLGAEDGTVSQIYDVYRASFTSPSGVMTERYMVVYYRNAVIGGTEGLTLTADATIQIGQHIEAGATAQDGGFIIGYKSMTEMEKDVLGSMETSITHSIRKEEKE